MENSKFEKAKEIVKSRIRWIPRNNNEEDLIRAAILIVSRTRGKSKKNES
jgi:hypothetical protein